MGKGKPRGAGRNGLHLNFKGSREKLLRDWAAAEDVSVKSILVGLINRESARRRTDANNEVVVCLSHAIRGDLNVVKTVSGTLRRFFSTMTPSERETRLSDIDAAVDRIASRLRPA